MRDLERWKDKVELSLDGRQIFFLFFGGAVAACLLFVLGVLVGKRLEARALALTPPPVEDPLAALDQLGDATSADDGLTFHKALTREAKREPIKIASAAPAIPVAARPEPAPAPEKEPKPAAPAPAPAAAAPKPVAPAPAAPKPAAPAPVAAAPKPAAPGPVKEPNASHFTLQLSAFPERAGAEEFMRKIQSAGYKPFLVVSEIPGKGVFYRVRVGDYGSRQAANDAKLDFESKQKMIAYVAKL